MLLIVLRLINKIKTYICEMTLNPAFCVSVVDSCRTQSQYNNQAGTSIKIDSRSFYQQWHKKHQQRQLEFKMCGIEHMSI